ncbi:MAG: prepilin-type N-terminal cleavage/methylation domain-containing protein [PVC group bacterium]|nr:prepilin-type N-terminal cleavage/methylation domain-containing protein [PVC group bacterium]
MKKNNFKLKNRGLTLIELLVSMSILVMLVVILQSVFSVALRAWAKSDNILQNSAKARRILERMTREISSATIISGDADFHCEGYDTGSGIQGASSSADEFYFIAALNKDNGEPNKSDLCEVGYWLDDDVLRRFYVTDGRTSGSPATFDFIFTTGVSNELEEQITDLQFEYYSGTTPVYTWDSRTDDIPAKIKITITVDTGKGNQTTNPDYISKAYSTVISLPQ